MIFNDQKGVEGHVSFHQGWTTHKGLHVEEHNNDDFMTSSKRFTFRAVLNVALLAVFTRFPGSSMLFKNEVTGTYGTRPPRDYGSRPVCNGRLCSSLTSFSSSSLLH